MALISSDIENSLARSLSKPILAKMKTPTVKVDPDLQKACGEHCELGGEPYPLTVNASMDKDGTVTLSLASEVEEEAEESPKGKKTPKIVQDYVNAM